MDEDKVVAVWIVEKGLSSSRALFFFFFRLCRLQAVSVVVRHTSILN